MSLLLAVSKREESLSLRWLAILFIIAHFNKASTSLAKQNLGNWEGAEEKNRQDDNQRSPWPIQ
jgi:hypothetical protein